MIVNAMFSFLEKIKKGINRTKWIFWKNNLKSVGANSHVDNGFSIIGGKYIIIGNNFSAGKNLKIHAFAKSDDVIIKLGNDVTITDNCYISAVHCVSIGNGVLFGENTFICDNFHGGNTLDEMSVPPNKRKITYKGAVKIGNNVWIGRNVCIMPGVQIGNGAIIGANAVVTHNIPEKCIAAGVPAIVIKNKNI